MVRRHKIADLARQMGVSEEALREFLQASSSSPLDAAEETILASNPAMASAEPSPKTYLEPNEHTEVTGNAGAVTLDTDDSTDTKNKNKDKYIPGMSWSDELVPAQQPERVLGSLGRYEDLGFLGVGGMGEVRRVRDPSLRRSMAMKIIHQDMMGSSQLVSRFIEEAQVEAQLQHPNIVPVYEIGQLPDGRHYFTMKEIRGRAFSTKIQAVHAASSSDRWRADADGTSFRDLLRIHQ